MFFKKKRYYILTAMFQVGYEITNGTTLFKKEGKATLYEALNHAAKILKIEVGRIMPLYFQEINKVAFDGLDASFIRINRESLDLETKAKLGGYLYHTNKELQ